MKLVKYLLLISLLFVTGCEKKEKLLTPPEEVFFEITPNVDIFSDAYLKDIIINTNTKVLDEYKIDTTKTGIHKYQINYEYESKKYIYEYELNITDTAPPFIFGGTSLTLLKDNTEDLCSKISYGDNYDSKAKCEIVGQYTPEKIGTYNLKMNVTDSSNNKTEKDIKVNIVEKINSSTTPNTKKLDFSEVKNKYSGENIEYAIDVSSWQEDVDYEKVKEAGVTAVMIRIGFQKEVDGTIKMDTYYAQNIEKAKAAGLKVGIYLYTSANEIKIAEAQAKWIVNELRGLKLELPIAFDWENWSTFNKYNVSFYELNMIANAFIDTLKEHGYKGCLYSSKYYLENIWKEAKNNPIWLAHYTESTNYQENHFMWQLSNIGRIPGILGDVDLNLFYTNIEY